MSFVYDNIILDDPNDNTTIIVYVANSQYTNVDAGKGESMIPMKVIQYPSDVSSRLFKNRLIKH